MLEETKASTVATCLFRLELSTRFHIPFPSQLMGIILHTIITRQIFCHSHHFHSHADSMHFVDFHESPGKEHFVSILCLARIQCRSERPQQNISAKCITAECVFGGGPRFAVDGAGDLAIDADCVLRYRGVEATF